MSATHTDLRSALEAMVSGQERSRRLVIRAGAHWQWLDFACGNATVEHRSARSSRLPDSLKLDPAKAQKMRDIGFVKQAGGDWNRLAKVGARPHEALDELAGQVMVVVRQLHNCDAPMQLDLEIDDREHPSNPEVIAAMRTLADKASRTDEARRVLYNRLVNARLLLPFDPASRPEADPEDAIERVEQRNGRPVFAAFTDLESLRRWRPLANDYMPSHGSVLFEWLVEEQAAALLLNPDGQVGGELFGNELAAMAEGVRRFVRKHGN